jgi:hypothetical protein
MAAIWQHKPLAFGSEGRSVADSSSGDEAGSKSRRWLRHPLVIALIGAAAAILAAEIAAQAGGIDIVSGTAPSARATVTIKPSIRPTATVTVTAGPVPTNPGPVTLPGCPVSQGCKGYNLIVRPEPGSGGATGITFATGAVGVGSAGDLEYEKSQDGTPEIVPYGGGKAYSVDVTTQQANQQGCVALTTSDPDSNPIVGFHQGLTFCVAINGQGVALVMETRPPGPDNVLYLRELYWPNPNS